jgi:hypothetical protein
MRGHHTSPSLALLPAELRACVRAYNFVRVWVGPSAMNGSSRSRSRGLRQVMCAPRGAQRAAQTGCADLVPRAIVQGMPTPPDSMVDDALRAPTEESTAGGECGWGGTGRDSGELKHHPDGGGPMGWCAASHAHLLHRLCATAALLIASYHTRTQKK